MTELTEFKRLRFFTGFFTTARDWEAEQNYHLEKLKLHNKELHTPGIIRREGEQLTVVATGGLKLQVKPGAALDSRGNTIFLGTPQELVIDKAALKLPEADPDSTVYDVYIVAMYSENPDDYVANVTQPEYSGHTRVAERPCFTVTRDRPDGQVHLRLALIRLQKNAGAVANPGDPQNPGVNEIDRRNVVYSSDARDLDDRLKAHDTRLEAHDHQLKDHDDWLKKHDGHLEAHDHQLKDHADWLKKHDGQLAAHDAWLKDHDRRLKDEDRYRRLHNRRLHTPGVLRGEGGGLAVKAAGGLNVHVAAGAAQDGEGNTVILEEPRAILIDPSVYHLPDLIFIALGHEDGPAGGAHPHLQVTTHKPDNRTWLELARINLQPGVTEISDPADPHNPGGNQINQNHVLSAGAVGVVEAQMAVETLRHIIQVMGRTRRDFAALDDQFPTPSAGDVRHAAQTVETLARIGCLRPGQLPELLVTLAAIEQDVGQEIHKKYGNVVDESEEFHGYNTAIRHLQEALRHGEERRILTAQDGVAVAARELSEIPIESPIADAGQDQTAVTFEDEAAVILDATESRARGGRDIVRYRWERGA